MSENWKWIQGYEGRYMISDLGRIRYFYRSKRGRLMHLCENWQGYKVVWFRLEQKHRKFFVHRLVAAAFISNPENKDVVNHRDENKQNNCISNLEWMSGGENTRYYFECRRKRSVKSSLSDDMNAVVADILKKW